jgi:long-chain fatty acid transport protein
MHLSRLFRLSVCSALALTTVSLNTAAQAAAFQILEQGTPLIGTAVVGQAAETSDASTSFYNPAAMVYLPSSEFMLGSQVILPYTNFSKSSRTTFTGDNGGNAGSLTPGVALYYVMDVSPKLKLGLSFTTPYGGNLNYTDGWVGRYFVQDILFYTLNLNPSIAYLVNNWLSVAAGVAVEYANLNETLALPITGEPDGQANIKADNFSPGMNLGALITPTPSTKIGIAFRSRITHNLRGNTTFLRIGTTPSTSTSMVMPQNLTISLDQGIGEKFNLLADVAWTRWSAMKDNVLHVDSYSITVPLNWIDTYRVGLGGQYHVTPDFMFQAGGSFDSSPTSASHRLPDLPMDRQIRLGAGIVYDIIKAAQLGFSYEYVNLGNANIVRNTSIGNLVGSYGRNYMNIVQASVNIKFC